LFLLFLDAFSMPPAALTPAGPRFPPTPAPAPPPPPPLPPPPPPVVVVVVVGLSPPSSRMMQKLFNPPPSRSIFFAKRRGGSRSVSLSVRRQSAKKSFLHHHHHAPPSVRAVRHRHARRGGCTQTQATDSEAKLVAWMVALVRLCVVRTEFASSHRAGWAGRSCASSSQTLQT
jgi:hypothetical protein